MRPIVGHSKVGTQLSALDCPALESLVPKSWRSIVCAQMLPPSIYRAQLSLKVGTQVSCGQKSCHGKITLFQEKIYRGKGHKTFILQIGVWGRCMKLLNCLPDQERLGQNTGKTVGPNRPTVPLGRIVFVGPKRPAILGRTVQKLGRKIQLGRNVWYPIFSP